MKITNFLVATCFASTCYAQVQIPQTNNSNSGSENMVVGTNISTGSQTAKLAINTRHSSGSSTIDGLLIKTSLDIFDNNPYKYAFKIVNTTHNVGLPPGPQNSTVFSVTPQGHTIIGGIDQSPLGVLNLRGEFYLYDLDANVFINPKKLAIGWTGSNTSTATKDRNLTIEYEGDNIYNSTILATFTPAGKVGFGAVEPKSEFHVYNGNSTNSLNLPGNENNVYGVLIENTGSSNNEYVLMTKTASGNTFSVSNDGVVYIGPSLNRTNPGGYRLYVEDGIRTERLKVDVATQNSWADFVFEDGYELLSYNELEKFIIENHHLPNIPSAEEVVKSGVDVLEINAKLLRQVEELSLRVIELNARIEKLEENEN